MAPKNRTEFRQMVAKEFVDALQQDGLEWKASWTSVNTHPCNGVTGKNYRGINAFYLGIISMINGYTDPRWVTMTQIMDTRGYYHPKQKWHLQKGSHGVFVEYWYPYDVINHKMMKWSDYAKLPTEEKEDLNRYILRCQYTPVFHASMVEGMPELPQAQASATPQIDDIVNTLSENMGVEILYDGGDQSFYRPSEDKIHLPKPELFHSDHALAAVTLHELAHATGHESRLNRQIKNAFGSDGYAYEELVAEISSCFMSFDLNTPMTQEHMDNHKAYVNGWIQGIQQKPEMLTKAIADAQNAAAYMDRAAGLISEEEYNQQYDGSMTVSAAQAENTPAYAAPRFDVPINVDEEMFGAPAEDFLTYARQMESPDYVKMPYDTNEYLTGLINEGKISAREALDVMTRCLPVYAGEWVLSDEHEYRFDDAGREGFEMPDARWAQQLLKEKYPDRDFDLNGFVPMGERLQAIYENEIVSGATDPMTVFQATRGCAVKTDTVSDYDIAVQYAKIAAKAAITHEKYAALGEKRYSVYQLSKDANDDLRFRSLPEITKHNLKVELKNYEKVYSGAWQPDDNLNRIYEKFNIGIKPENYRGHSLSVSDVVFVELPGDKARAYYVDRIGFTEVPELSKEIEAAQQAERDALGYNEAPLPKRNLVENDASQEQYERIEVYGMAGVYTKNRIARATVPEGWYAYDLRGSDLNPTVPSTFEEHVLADHAGTILLPRKVSLGYSEFWNLKDGDLRFLGGNPCSLKERAQEIEDAQQKKDIASYEKQIKALNTMLMRPQENISDIESAYNAICKHAPAPQIEIEIET